MIVFITHNCLDKDSEKISDAAQTFRNLRSQLIKNHDRSRTKYDLNKIQSHKNSEQVVRKTDLQEMSRNTGQNKTNTLTPKDSKQSNPAFEKRFDDPTSKGNFIWATPTTLYMESVSNRNNDGANEQKLTGNTLEEDNWSAKPIGFDRVVPLNMGHKLQMIDKSSKQSLSFDEVEKIPEHQIKSEFSVLKAPRKRNRINKRKGKAIKKKRRGVNNTQPRPEFLLCDNEDVFDSNIMPETSKTPVSGVTKIKFPQNMFSSAKHNLSKVEEEDADETYYEVYS